MVCGDCSLKRATPCKAAAQWHKLDQYSWSKAALSGKSQALALSSSSSSKSEAILSAKCESYWRG